MSEKTDSFIPYLKSECFFFYIEETKYKIDNGELISRACFHTSEGEVEPLVIPVAVGVVLDEEDVAVRV